MKLPEIIYEDAHLLVINKPAGLRSIPDRYQENLPSASQLFKKKYGKIYMVHRLDKDTSGSLVMAKDAETHKELNTQFSERQIRKKYLVLIEGAPVEHEGVIDQPIKHDPSNNKFRINKKGKESKTLYKLLETFNGYSLIEADIRTGRTHQIRVHLPYAGMPLVCDPLYGNKQGLFLSRFKRKYKKSLREEYPLMGRLSLHSHSLQFQHPATKEEMEIISPMPKDFRASLAQLRKWAKARNIDN